MFSSGPRQDLKFVQSALLRAGLDDIPSLPVYWKDLVEAILEQQEELLQRLENVPRSLDSWATSIDTWATSKGWEAPKHLDDEEAIHFALSKLMLVVSEVSEAAEAARLGDLSNFREELADAVIRILHIAGSMQFSLDEEVRIKMARNWDRSYKHGKKA